MQTSEVIRILLFFRDIEKEIKFCRRIIDDFEDRFYSEGGAVNYDEPVVQSGTTSNRTLRLALNLPESVAPSCRQLERFIEEISTLKTEIFSELEKLPYIQKAVIYGFYIEGFRWEKISQREKYSVRQCKTYRDEGIKQLCLIFTDNPRIDKYRKI